jgi:hypothetical protein
MNLLSLLLIHCLSCNHAPICGDQWELSVCKNHTGQHGMTHEMTPMDKYEKEKESIKSDGISMDLDCI